MNTFVPLPLKSPQVLNLEALVKNNNATVDAIRAGILAVSSKGDVDSMSVRNTVCLLITQAFQIFISQIDKAKDDGNLNFMSTITGQLQPNATAFAKALDQNAGFKKYQDLRDFLSLSFALFVSSCVVYEVFVRDARARDQISKNSQAESSLSRALENNRQEFGTILAELTVSDVVQQEKAARLAQGLYLVNNQRMIANKLKSEVCLGGA